MRIRKLLFTGVVAVFFLIASTCTKDPVRPGSNNSTGSITDIEGNIYTTVKIGNQEWTVENLRTTKYNDGISIPLDTSSLTWSYANTPKYCYYNNTIDTDNIKKFGALYNWYVIDPANPHKIAPVGWHVSDTTDWNTLENYLITNGYNWDNSTTGNKIVKSLAAKTDWYINTDTTSEKGLIGNDLNKNNRSGFSALPGGFRADDGFFNGIGYCGYWWCTMEVDTANVWTRYLYTDYVSLGRYIYSKGNWGFSVRLVRD